MTATPLPPETTHDDTKKSVFGASVDIDIPTAQFPTPEAIANHEAVLVGCEHGWMDSVHREPKDPTRRFQLHYRKFLPTTTSVAPKAVVIWIHGIQTHSGKAYQMDTPKDDGDEAKDAVTSADGTVKLNTALLAETLVQQHGFTLYALDLLGHGFSEGKRFYVKDWTENREDCIQFVEYVASLHVPNTPVFVAGESYGGCLAIHVANAYQQAKAESTSTATTSKLEANVDSVVLVAPAIIGDLPPYPVYCLLRYVLAPLYPLWVPFFMPNPVSADRIWRHPEIAAMHTKDHAEYVIDGSGQPFRLGTAVQLLLALEGCRRVIPQFRMPFCVLHGTEDHAVPIVGTDFLEAKAATPNEQRVVYRIEGGYHDLIGDWPASKVCVPHMLEWIQKRLGENQKK